MISRYARPEMTGIWEPDNRFRIWLAIEAHACDAMAEQGIIPKSAAKNMLKSFAGNGVKSLHSYGN